MSIWYNIKDAENVSYDPQEQSIDVCFLDDHNGGNYVQIPVEFIEKAKANTYKPVRVDTDKAKEFAEWTHINLWHLCKDGRWRYDGIKEKWLNKILTFNKLWREFKASNQEKGKG